MAYYQLLGKGPEYRLNVAIREAIFGRRDWKRDPPKRGSGCHVRARNCLAQIWRLKPVFGSGTTTRLYYLKYARITYVFKSIWVANIAVLKFYRSKPMQKNRAHRSMYIYKRIIFISLGKVGTPQPAARVCSFSLKFTLAYSACIRVWVKIPSFASAHSHLHCRLFHGNPTHSKWSRKWHISRPSLWNTLPRLPQFPTRKKGKARVLSLLLLPLTH